MRDVPIVCCGRT